MLRLLICVIFLLIFCVISLPFWALDRIFRKKNPAFCDRMNRAMVRWACRVLVFLSGTRLTVKGQDNLPPDTLPGEDAHPALYIANHRSYFDILVLYPLLPGMAGFLGKKELQKIPLVSQWMRRIHCLFLDRSDARQGLATILQAIDHIKSGISVVIFPEGTRNTNPDEKELLPFHEGSFKVATRTGCPVIPIAITHTSEIFEDHIPFVRSKAVTVEFLPPVDAAGMDRKEQRVLGKTTQDLIQRRVAANE